MALHRADPAALRQDDGDRLLLDHRRPVDLARRRASSMLRPALVAELFLQRCEVALQSRALARRALDQLREVVALLRQRIALLGRSPFPRAGATDRRRMLRIASACRSRQRRTRPSSPAWVRPPSRMISITRSRLRKAMRKPSSSSSRSSILPIRTWLRRTSTSNWKAEPGGQRLLEAHHARRAGRVEHVEVEREADFEVGQPVKALEQQLGVDRPRPRLEDQPHLLVAFVLHVGEDRQLLVGDQLPRSARSAWPLARRRGSR